MTSKSINSFATELGCTRKKIERILRDLGIQIETHQGKAGLLNDDVQIQIKQQIAIENGSTNVELTDCEIVDETPSSNVEISSLAIAPKHAVTPFTLSYKRAGLSRIEATTEAINSNISDFERDYFQYCIEKGTDRAQMIIKAGENLQASTTQKIVVEHANRISEIESQNQ